MKIGVFPILEGAGGGVYQYSLSLLRALIEWQHEGGAPDEFVVLHNDPKSPRTVQDSHAVKMLAPGLPDAPENWQVAPLSPHPGWKRHALETGYLAARGQFGEGWRRWKQQNAPASHLPTPDARIKQHALNAWLHKLKLDLIVCAMPCSFAFETDIPFVMAIHDLQHRLQPQFPEVSQNGEWELREYVCRNAARYAAMLLADSRVGCEDLLHFYGEYGLSENRVRALPFLPANYLNTQVSLEERARVRAEFSLPERYVFYPAQFWPHKNHARLVEALSLLKRDGLEVPLVLCGSRSGEAREANFARVLETAERGGVAALVRCLDYVPDAAMSALYAEATALVMPTFFGPTNIPTLEAWAFGCPVLTSDIRGVREQCGNAALLADPNSVEEIANALRQLWTNADLRESLAARGHARLASYTPQEFRARLVAAIHDAAVNAKLFNAQSLAKRAKL